MFHAIIQDLHLWQIVIAVVVGCFVTAFLFFALGVAILPSLICGVITSFITLVVLMGFGGLGKGGGKGSESGQGIEKAEPIKKSTPTEVKPGKKVKKELTVTVTLKDYKLHNRIFTFSEFKDELHSMSLKPPLIIIDYCHQYKAIHTKQYQELSIEFPEIYFKETNK